eukprot:Gb_38587 [translate_table: standard]
MTHSVHSRQSVTRISFDIYMPQDGCHIDDAIAHISTVSSTLEKSSGIKVAILKNLDLSWAAVFSVWRGGANVDESTIHLLEAAAFTKGMRCVVRIVDSGWFELTSQEKRQGVPLAELCLGDIVSVRRIYSSWKKQDVLSYCCLALLKAYFCKLRGIVSASFYSSLDGKRIIGLGVWESVESANAVRDHPNPTPAETFWKALGAKDLKFDVCQVVYVTYQTPTNDGRPGFHI